MPVLGFAMILGLKNWVSGVFWGDLMDPGILKEKKMTGRQLKVKRIFSPLVLALAFGCATAPREISLDYSVIDSDLGENFLRGLKFTIEPFDDARTNKLIANNAVMKKGEDAGLWIANAIYLEAKRAGADVLKVQKGVRPAEGYHLRGKVNVIESMLTGWQLGGLLGVISKSGLKAHINVTISILKNGLEYKTHTYDEDIKTTNSALRNMFSGGTDVQGSLQLALGKLVTEKIIPDLKRDIQ